MAFPSSCPFRDSKGRGEIAMVEIRWRRPGGKSVDMEKCDPRRVSYGPQVSDMLHELIRQDQGSDEPRLQKWQAPEPHSEPPKSPVSTLDRIIVSCEFA